MNRYLVVGRTALAFWRTYRDGGSMPIGKVRRLPPLGDAPNAWLLEKMPLLGVGSTERIHIRTCRSVERCVREGVRVSSCSHWTGPQAEGIPLGGPLDGLFVETPSMTFVSMAECLSLVHLVELGFELCGTYGLSRWDARGFCDAEPLLQPGRLQRALGGFSNLRGLRKARRAAAYVLKGSASPRETTMAMLMTLPHALGGCGFRGAVLNAAVGSPGARGLRGDLVWPKERVVLEYESRMFHRGDEAYVRDSKRRNLLAGQGYRVITATNEELRDDEAFRRLHAGVAEVLHRRWNPRCSNFEDRQRELRRALLSASFRHGSAHLLDS